jgi:hypothetical protein
MFRREAWSQVLIPKTTKEAIKKTAEDNGIKIWEVVDGAVKKSTNNG